MPSPTSTASCGWAKPGPETAIITAEAQTVSVCMDRTDNSIAVLKDRLGMTEEQVIHLAVPGSQDNAMTTAAQAIVAYPNVKKWLIAAATTMAFSASCGRSSRPATLPTT